MSKPDVDIDFGLCSTCSHFKLLTFKGSGRFKRDCSEVELNGTPLTVSHCKLYFNRSWTKLTDLEEIAWNLDAHRKSQIGFKPPDPLKERAINDPFNRW